MQGGAVGAATGDGLETQRHQHDQRDRLEAGEENRAPAQHRAAIGEQMHGQQRLWRAPFVEHEHHQCQQRDAQQGDDLIIAPAATLANFGNAQQQRTEADDHQHGAEVINDGFALRDRQADQRAFGDPPGEQAQRQVDQKHPAP